MPDATTRRFRVLSPWLIPGLCCCAAVWLWATAAPRHEDGYGRQFFGLWRTRHVLVALLFLWCATACVLAALSRRALRRFLVANGAVAIAWIGLEAAGLARIVSYPLLLGVSAEEQVGLHLVPNLDIRGVAREDLAQLWNLPSQPIPYHYRTDRRGFRNEPDRESADVYCLGDSYLVAGLLPFQEVLSAQLEQRLARPVMNVALVGLSPQAEGELLRDTHLPYDGRLVLQFLFEGNDLLDSARWRKTASAAGESASWKERTLANSIVERLQILTQPQPEFVPRHTGWIGETAYRFQWLANSFAGLDAEQAAIAESLSAMRQDVQAAGGSYAVVLIPATIRVLGPMCRFPGDSELVDWRAQCGPLPGFLRAWSEREGVPLLDLTAALDGATQRGEIPWFPADTHWNAIGHRVAAEAIAAWPVVRAWADAHPAN